MISVSIQLVGDDFNSDQSAESASLAWLVLFTTFFFSCSLIHRRVHFRRISFYELLCFPLHLYEDLLLWQFHLQACYHLQLHGAVFDL